MRNHEDHGLSDLSGLINLGQPCSDGTPVRIHDELEAFTSLKKLSVTNSEMRRNKRGHIRLLSDISPVSDLTLLESLDRSRN